MLIIKQCFIVAIALFGIFSVSDSRAEPLDPVIIGFDGAYGVKGSTSAKSIEFGIEAAIHEINAAGGVLGGRPLKLMNKDNRSISARGVDNFKAFAKVKDLVAVIGGRFSPVMLDQISLAHEEKLMLINAWGSATAITRHAYRPSYTFRVSLSDEFGVPEMIYAALSTGAKRVGLMVPNTGWGRSSVAAAKAEAETLGFTLLEPVWYNWGERDFSSHYKQLLQANAEVLILVANDLEGSAIVRHMASLEPQQRLPVISHWGVTGGTMFEKASEALSLVDFQVVQTFSFTQSNGPVKDRVANTVRVLKGIANLEEIAAPVGFAHAYDIIYLLARAIDHAGSTDRSAIRNSFEAIRHHEGLVKTYNQPFGPDDFDAFDVRQVFMARYNADGQLVPVSAQK